MTFEFIITHQTGVGEPILDILRQRLREVLEANLNDVDEDALAAMMRTTFARPQPTTADSAPCTVLGFSLELTEETASIRDVVDQFADALMADPIAHVVKCEDPLLHAELATRARELFDIEMKLRRVLTIIYLYAYPKADPYDLLREEVVQPMSSTRPPAEQMKGAAENQFFHLTFGQYVNLNHRPAIKDLVALIRNESTYEAFRAELLRQPVEHEDDASFLAGLKERMDAIEKMRNAVAHNRRPTKKVSNDYQNALPLVNQALDEYLGAIATDWQDSLNTELPWDSAAREAVEGAMEHADWNEENKTISLPDPVEYGIERTVTSLDELWSCLEEVARGAFYANCPRDSGEFVFECNEYGVVEGVLNGYEDRLAEFFAPANEGGE